MPRKAEGLTEPHCYSFFKEDVEALKTNGWSPKELLRLGILAKKDNPQLLSRIKEMEEASESLLKKFNRIARENVDLKKKVAIIEAEAGSRQFED